MADRDPNTSSDGTSELPPVEPTGTAGTEPIAPGEPTPPPPSGGYASIGSRRGGPVLQRGRVIVAIVALVVAFVLGFFVGKSQAPEPTRGGGRVEKAAGGGKQQQGGKARPRQRKACRRALDLSAQLIEGQQQALANQAALVQAIVAEEADQVQTLTATGEQLEAQIAQARADFDRALHRCRG